MEAKDLRELIDNYDETKQTRLSHDRASKKLKEEETAMKQAIISHLEEEGLTAAGGGTVQLTLDYKDEPRVGDWTEFYKYIKKEDAFDCLFRRINPKSIRERIEVEEEIPGIYQEKVAHLSESRAKLKG